MSVSFHRYLYRLLIAYVSKSLNYSIKVISIKVISNAVNLFEIDNVLELYGIEQVMYFPSKTAMN